MEESTRPSAKFGHHFRIPFAVFLDVVDAYASDHQTAGVKHKHSNEIQFNVLVALMGLGTICSFEILKSQWS